MRDVNRNDYNVTPATYTITRLPYYASSRIDVDIAGDEIHHISTDDNATAKDDETRSTRDVIEVTTVTAQGKSLARMFP